MKINKESIIGECINEHPEIVEVLLDEGFRCIGCFAAHFETIEEGLKMHGKTDEEIKKIILKLNGKINEYGKN